jgi:hypothetical protein
MTAAISRPWIGRRHSKSGNKRGTNGINNQAEGSGGAGWRPTAGDGDKPAEGRAGWLLRVIRLTGPVAKRVDPGPSINNQAANKFAPSGDARVFHGRDSKGMVRRVTLISIKKGLLKEPF